MAPGSRLWAAFGPLGRHAYLMRLRGGVKSAGRGARGRARLRISPTGADRRRDFTQRPPEWRGGRPGALQVREALRQWLPSVQRVCVWTVWRGFGAADRSLCALRI